MTSSKERTDFHDKISCEIMRPAIIQPHMCLLYTQTYVMVFYDV